MAKFTISAHQEMYADEQIEANTLPEALEQFKNRLKNGQVDWRPSDEDMDYTVSQEDGAGNVVSEVSSGTVDVAIRA